MKIMENFVLKTQEREEAIQLLAMDPQVYGELLTHHRRGHGVEEALRIQIPPPAGHQDVPQMGSCRDRSLRRRKSIFVALSLVVSDFLGIYRRKKQGKGATRGPQACQAPPGCAQGACGLPRSPLTWFSCSPRIFCSGKNHSEDFIPFGLHLIFFFEKGQKHGKNRNWHLALS